MAKKGRPKSRTIPKRNYDVAFKQALDGLARAFATLLRKGREIVKIEILSVERKKWLERQADALFKIIFRDGTEWMLHIEIQATNDRTMAGRMMVYGGLDSIRYHKRPYQVVLYIGEGAMRMTDTLESEHGPFRYDLIDIRTLNPDLFLQSESPEVWAYAYLTAPDVVTRRALLGEIIHALATRRISADARESGIAALVALAPLRNEEQFIKEKIDQMAYEFKVKLENIPGYERVLAQGVAQGVAQGARQKEKELAKNMSKDGLPLETIARYLQLSVEETHLLLEER